MVFGFGKKKEAAQPPSAEESALEVSMQEIPSIIGNFEKPRIASLLEEARDLKGRIEDSQKKIQEIISHLESDDLKLDDVDKNLRTIGRRGKDVVVSTIKKETKTKLPSVESYEDVLGLSGDVNQILKRMGDILGLHTRVLHVFARKYADKLKDEIAELAKSRDSLQRLISEHEGFKSGSRFILETAGKIHELEDENNKRTHRIREISRERETVSKHISEVEKEVADMRKSPEYGQFLAIKEKIESLDHEKREIREKISTQFSKISRPLNKYSYVSSFDKPLKKIMEELIADPYQALSPQNKEPIREILEAVTKSVVAGNVSVKDSDKSVDHVEETIDSLDGFIGLKSAYAEKISKLESGLSVFDSKKLSELEGELVKERSNLEDLSAIQKKVEEEIAENLSSLDGARKDLERGLTGLSNRRTVIRAQT